MFKKKSLKFTFEKVSRDMRHAEALKARETSRFKRLSMIRSINDCDSDEKTMETPKESVRKVPEKKPSRLEMLFKWKQEKQIKKEMEKLAKKKPFYTGGNKNTIESKVSQSFKSSFINQSNSSNLNSSKSTRSKLVTPNVTAKPSRILNSKQGVPNSTIQAKVSNTKQGLPTSAFQSSRIPNSKQTLLPKTASNLSRSNSTATVLRKFPASTNDKTTSKPGSSLARSNSTAAVSRKFGNPSTSDKAAPSKSATNQKVPVFNKILNHCTNGANTLKSKDVSKPVSKGSSEGKFSFKPQEGKPVKVGIGLPKLTPSVTAVSKGIPIQNKMPVSSMNKKFGSNSKLDQKSTPQAKDNPSLRKGYCFRTAISNSLLQRPDTVLKTPLQGTPKKQQGKSLKKIEEKNPTKEFSEQSLDNIPDVTFNSDISIIKPARPSFAPVNFAFQPPEGLNNFIFDDDDCDVYQALEEIKLKFMSRTSTPSKDSDRKSSIKSSKESLGSNDLVRSVEKSDVSNSNNINISELMTPVSFKLEIDNEETNEALNKEICNEVACDIIANIKETDIGENKKSCDKLTSILPIKTILKEAEVIEDQEIKNIAFTSPISFLVNEDSIIANQGNEEVNSFSPIKAIEPDNIENLKSQEGASISPLKTVVKEAHVIANQMNNIDLSSVSPIKIKETDIPANQESCENFLISVEDVDAEVDRIIIQETNAEMVSDQNTDLNKTETFENNKNSELQGKEIFDCPNITENQKRNSVEVSGNEVQFTCSFKDGASENTSKDTAFFDEDDSLIDSIDLNKIQLIKLDDKDSDEDDFPSPQVLKCAEGKSSGAVAKRVSMLKHLSVMNSIAETIETDESHSVNLTESSKNNKGSRGTPRRSKRISNLISFDTLSESPLKSSEDSPSCTPRRSLRLKNVSTACSVSPFKEKNASYLKPRRSMRLIDLSTPEKAAEKLGENFENLDPNNFLIDFESPDMPTISKSKKVSLLYSPEKRKSIRKSIRGDLMSFSPV